MPPTDGKGRVCLHKNANQGRREDLWRIPWKDVKGQVCLKEVAIEVVYINAQATKGHPYFASRHNGGHHV